MLRFRQISMLRFRQISLFVVCAVLLVLAVPPARCPGVTRTWTGNIDNNWYDGNNWNPIPIGGPSSDDTLLVDNGSPETTSNVTTDNGGSITVNGSSASASFGDLHVGDEDMGALAILDGGSVSNADAYLGITHSGDGRVIVDGLYSTWTNSGSLYIGGNAGSAVGTGVVTVQNDGELEVGGTLKLWSTGTLTLDGGTVQTQVFDRTSGAFNWTSGTVQFTNDLTIDTGELFGDNVQVTAPRTLGVAATLTLGSAGKLNISEGDVTVGSFDNSAGGTFAFIGGTLTVDVGSFDPGTSNFTLSGTGNPTLTLINGATMNLSGYLIVGGTDSGSLNIESGSSVSSNWSAIAYFSGSAGAVTVTGAGSTWTNNGSLVVGNEDMGTLDILNGGSVSNADAYLGSYLSSGDGTVTVSGLGSTWTNSGSLYIGGDGTNSGGAGTVVVGVGGEVLVGTGGSGDVIAHNDTCSISMNGGKMTIAGGFATTGGGSGTRAALNYQFDNAGTFGQIICEPTGETADIQNTTITYSFLGGGNTFVPTVAGCMDFIVAETITGFLTNAADAAYDNMDELLAAANGGTGYPSYAYGIVTIDSDDYVDGAYDGYKALRLSFLPADADLGGLCDGSDLLTWQNGYSNGDTTWDKGDYNLSGLVDGPDLLIWQNNYGKTLGDCSGMGATSAAAAVPEPATLCLLGLGAVALIRRKR